MFEIKCLYLLDKEIEIEMVKLGLANEKKKGRSKILEYIEHQKGLCKENPKDATCSNKVFVDFDSNSISFKNTIKLRST